MDRDSVLARTIQLTSTDSLQLSELRDAFYLSTVERVSTCVSRYTDDATLQQAMVDRLYQGMPHTLSTYPIHVPFHQWASVWIKEFWEAAIGSQTPQLPVEPPPYVRLDRDQCPYRLGREVCDTVDADLKRAKIRPTPDAHRLRLRECGSCKLPEVATTLAKIPTKQARDLLYALRFSFYYPHSGVGLPTAPYHCPIVDVAIVEPCATTECPHYVDYPWSNNCLRIHVSVHGPASTPHEIAVLLNRPVAEIEQGLTYAMRGVRAHALEEQRSVGSIPKDFEDVTHAVHLLCAVCEKPLPRSTKVERKGEHYCSSECAEVLPPAYVRVEHLYGRSYQDVVAHAKKTFSTQEEAYEVLGLPVPVSPAPVVAEPVQSPELMRSASTRSKGIHILKRTGRKPTWMTDIEEVLSRRLKALRIPGFELVLD